MELENTLYILDSRPIRDYENHHRRANPGLVPFNR
jgi:hypothetical protein